MTVHAPDTYFQELVKRVRAGGADQEVALNELASAILRQVAAWAPLFSWTPDDGLADDVASETAWRVVQRLDDYDIQQPFKPWLKAIARNIYIDAIRADHETDQDLESLVSARDPNPSVEEIVEQRDIVRRLSQDLSSMERHIFERHYLGGLDITEIALVLDLSKARVYQIREHIRQKARGLK